MHCDIINPYDKTPDMVKNYLKTLLLATFAMMLPLVASADVEINETTFPDESFRSWVLGQSYGQDGVLTEEEIAGVTTINLMGKRIQSLKGLEHFTELTSLYCTGNQLTELDVSECIKLTELECTWNQLTTLDVSKNTALTTLTCAANKLTALDVSQNIALEILGCGLNLLTSLDVSQNTLLTELYCQENLLTELDISKNILLKRLGCSDNQLTSLNISGHTALESLKCSGNRLAELDVSGCPELEEIICQSNQINGEAMDALVESLPTVNRGHLGVINHINEQNVMTKSQVSAAKAKGWYVHYNDSNNQWQNYEGSDDPTETAFLSEGVAWVDGFGYEQDGHHKTDDVKLFYYTTAGDTLIGEKSYFRIQRIKKCRTKTYEESKYEIFDDNLCFFMREDDAGDVWLYAKDKNVFYELSGNTLYDHIADDLVGRDLFLFNAKKKYAVGDKLPLGMSALVDPNGFQESEDYWHIYSLDVEDVSERNLLDGKSYPIYNNYFLESIGPLDGPLSGIGSPNSYSLDFRQLFAFYRDGQLIYKNEGYIAALEEYFPNILGIITGANPNGIENISGSTSSSDIYDLQGRKLAEPQKGINILRHSDGTTRKVLIK